MIHCHDYKTRLFGLCAARGLKVRKVATNHLWPRGNLKGRVYETIDGMLFNGFDKVVAVSELIERECRPFLLRKDKLICIPNGIDPRLFTFDDREEARRATRAQLRVQRNRSRHRKHSSALYREGSSHVVARLQDADWAIEGKVAQITVGRGWPRGTEIDEISSGPEGSTSNACLQASVRISRKS